MAMDCQPLQPSVSQLPFAWHPTRNWTAPVICTVLIIVPVLNDLFRPHINMSILFLLPMLFCAWQGNRKAMRMVLVLCVLLTYLGFGVRMIHTSDPNWRWGLLNRSFVATALVIGGYLLESMVNNLQYRSVWRPTGVDAEHVIIEEIIFSSQRFAAVFMSLSLATGIFILDLVTPGQVNVTILYSVSLLMIIWTRSHAWLWSVVILLVGLSLLGWAIGEAPTTTRDSFEYLKINRCIAICMLVFFGIIIHLATKPFPKCERIETIIDTTGK